MRVPRESACWIICDHAVRAEGRADAPVIEAVVDRQYVRAMAEHLVCEPLHSLDRVFAADGRHDHVDNGKRESFLQCAMKEMRIGVERVNEWALRNSRRERYGRGRRC